MPVDRKPARATTWLKIALLCAVIAVDVAVWPELWREMGAAGFLRVPLAFLVLAFGLVCAAFTQPALLRWFYALALAIGAFLVLGYRFSVGSVTSYYDFATTIDARSAAPDALAMYGLDIAAAALVACLTGLAIAIRPPSLANLPRWLSRLAASVPLLVFAALVAILNARQGQARGIPSSWQGLGFSALYAVDLNQSTAGPRQEVSVPRTGDPARGDIVLVVDESVSGNYLDLNAPGGARSGLAEAPRGWQVHDFGIASSITNCSMHTNVSLRFGAQMDDFKQRVATGPSIWAHAQAAGYRTVYLYGQRGGVNENFFTDAERAEIDDARYFEDVAMIDRDHRLAAELVDLFNNDTAEFILVNKAGVHFPLTPMYPMGEGRFVPEVDADNADETAEFWQGYRNNYRNAIEWSVGGFFDIIMDGVRDDALPVTMVYTSDHGQTFYERGEPGSGTHCRGQPAIEEAAVPLLVVQHGGDRSLDWGGALADRHDASSQFRVFPSLLLAMGYDPQAARDAYGPSLIDRGDDPMVFAVGMHFRLGAEPRWFPLDPEQVFRPVQ